MSVSASRRYSNRVPLRHCFSHAADRSWLHTKNLARLRAGQRTARYHAVDQIKQKAKEALDAGRLEVFADRGYFSGEQILASEQAGVTVTLPKPLTSGAKAAGRFCNQDFVYVPEQDAYRCPAGEALT
jgi:hypothetical protein